MRRITKSALVMVSAAAATFGVVSQLGGSPVRTIVPATNLGLPLCDAPQPEGGARFVDTTLVPIELPTLPTVTVPPLPEVEVPCIPLVKVPKVTLPTLPSVTLPEVTIPRVTIPVPVFFPTTTTTTTVSCEASTDAVANGFIGAAC